MANAADRLRRMRTDERDEALALAYTLLPLEEGREHGKCSRIAQVWSGRDREGVQGGGDRRGRIE